MDKDKLKRKYLADTLRVMATKIENGFPLDEEQEKMLVKLSREIVILHPNDYEVPKNDKGNIHIGIISQGGVKPSTFIEAIQKVSEIEENSGKEPGE